MKAQTLASNLTLSAVMAALIACAHTGDRPKDTTTTGATSTWTSKNETMGPNGMPVASQPSQGRASDGTSAAPQQNDPAPVVFPRPAPSTDGPSSSANPGSTPMGGRDRGDSPPPLKQGNTKSELNITAAIRRAVVASNSLGLMAKNVKIITVGTKVTLRGPVKTAEERDIVESHAKQAAGVSEVDNQLEVKTK